MHRPALGAEPSTMANPLDRHEAPLRDILDRLFRSRVAVESTDPLDVLRHALAAGAAAVLHVEPRGARQLAVDRATQDRARFERSPTLGRLAAEVVASRQRRTPRSFGVFAADDTAVDAGAGTGAGAGGALLLVELADPQPLDLGPPSYACDQRTGVAPHADARRCAALALSGVGAGLLDLGEPLCHVVRAYARACGLGERDEAPRSRYGVDADPRAAALCELAVLNELRRACGVLPHQLEAHCFELFRRTLDQVHMIFEPVVVLGEHYRRLWVRSWEALARLGRGATHAPHELFATAELWGGHFLVELDATLADRALCRFADAHRHSPYRHGAPRPVSVNVSLRSLWSTTYEQRLAESLRRADLGRHKVVLELSEKEPIRVPSPLCADDALPRVAGPPRFTAPRTIQYGTDASDSDGRHTNEYGDEGAQLGGASEPCQIEAFRRRLDDLHERLDLNFAIDDLGSGYATLERLLQLSGATVKISRSVLHHPQALDEIGSVLRLLDVRERRTVIVEGVDDVCPVSLHSLYRLGVRQIQGHVTGLGGEDLTDLPDPTRRRLAAMVRGVA